MIFILFVYSYKYKYLCVGGWGVDGGLFFNGFFWVRQEDKVEFSGKGVGNGWGFDGRCKIGVGL